MAIIMKNKNNTILIKYWNNINKKQRDSVFLTLHFSFKDSLIGPTFCNMNQLWSMLLFWSNLVADLHWKSASKTLVQVWYFCKILGQWQMLNMITINDKNVTLPGEFLLIWPVHVTLLCHYCSVSVLPLLSSTVRYANFYTICFENVYHRNHTYDFCYCDEIKKNVHGNLWFF